MKVFLNSIRSRALLTIIASELLLTLALGIVAITYTHRHLLESFDTALRARAMSIAALVHYADENVSGLEFDASLVPPSLESGHEDTYLVKASSAGVIARSPNWPQAFEVPESLQISKIEVGGDAYRGTWIFDVPVSDTDPRPAPTRLSVFYATSSHRIERQMMAATKFFAACSAIILALTAPVAYWGLRRSLTPLQTLAAQSARVSTKNWDVDVDLSKQPTELKPLVNALNEMLSGLGRSFAQQKEFLGNAAHELKTPVAVLKSTLQTLALKPRTCMEYQEGLNVALQDLERMEKLVQWMLRLAKAEQWANGSGRAGIGVVDLSSTCEAAISRLAGFARERGTTIELFKNAESQVRADPEDLQIVWANLLDNAIRHSPEHASVKLFISNSKDRVEVRVIDDGPGISKDDLPHIFERFHRGDPSRTRETGGFGLGLAIAKAFTEAYRGSIRFDEDLKTGTCVVVQLPAMQQAVDNNDGRG